MIWLSMPAWRLVHLFRWRSGERDEEGLRTHIGMQTEEYPRKGMPSEEARFAAL